MLQTQTVEPSTLTLLKELMEVPELSNFSLVGGTAENKELVDAIRIYSTQDIIAMKVNAILGRGKKKDFWDIFEILHHFTIEQVIQYHSLKFPSHQLMITIPQAFVYFQDADVENPRKLTP